MKEPFSPPRFIDAPYVADLRTVPPTLHTTLCPDAFSIPRNQKRLYEKRSRAEAEKCQEHGCVGEEGADES